MNYALAVTNPQRKESSDTQKNIPNKNSTNLNLQSSIIRKSLSKVDIVPINQEGLSPYVSFELFIPFIDNKGGEEIINKTEYEKISVDGLEKVRIIYYYCFHICEFKNFFTETKQNK